MKSEKKEIVIKNIDWKDFKKKDIKLYHHRRINGSVKWIEINANDLVREYIEESLKQGWKNPICLAIYEPVTEDEIKEIMDSYPGLWNYGEARDFCLYSKSYLDKYMTPFGAQTYLIRGDVEHLYSKRNHFYTKDDYFDVQKMNTLDVYLISF